jgi:predicted transcriptional regulator
MCVYNSASKVSYEMTNAKPKGGGGRLTRSETVTVRLDPKLRYLAELAALKHRRTLSSFIEWAIEDTLHRVKLREGNDDSGTTVADDAELLWDVDDAERFVKLALRYPELLTHEEQKRWKLIRENGFLWRGRFGSNDEWEWTIKEQSLILSRLREHWDRFCAVARAEEQASVLPSWASTKPSGKKVDAFDDDIPF